MNKKYLKTASIIAASCLAGLGIGLYGSFVVMDHYGPRLKAESTAAIYAPEIEDVLTPSYSDLPVNLTGSYLASNFAQNHHDWTRASAHLQKVLQSLPGDSELLKKAMVLSMGAGEGADAIDVAQQLYDTGNRDVLTLLFLASEAFKIQDYDLAQRYVEGMESGSLTDFIGPLLHSWAAAAQGVNDTKALQGNIVHIHHAILIADYLGESDQVLELLQRAEGATNATLDDLIRIADIYGHIDQIPKAKSLYEQVLVHVPGHARALEKLAAIENRESMKLFERMSSIEAGVAQAMYDMAEILFSDQADDSARVFAHLALYLKPDMHDSTLLMASISARNGRAQEAIEEYSAIPPEHPFFLEARHEAAGLLEDAGRIDEAIDALEILARDYDDLESLIKIGDIQRRNEQFSQSIETYNKAARKLEDGIPADYWHLHYVRGMSYERAGDWDRAEADLEAALAFQPNHPYVLNYLGYAWADRGENLDRSLDMIRKALALRPDDGYITDSLGWVYFRLGEYQEAVPYLEKAIELLPYDAVVNNHLGDAYWQVGRKLEARFQWERAKNHAEDEEIIAQIQDKLLHGLHDVEVVKRSTSSAAVKEARSAAPPLADDDEPERATP